MNIPDLCPACLTELPDDYPFDHVEIDLALEGRRDLYRRMRREQRAETIRTGRDRGISDHRLSLILGPSIDNIAALAGRTMRRTDANVLLDVKVRELHAQEYSDSRIAMRLDVSYERARNSRLRQKLPALYGPRGVRLSSREAA